MRKAGLLFCALLGVFAARAQYAPQAGLPGSTAIPAADSRFVAWASACAVQRGYMDIANHSLGLASAGNDTNALGKPDLGIVSLGDSGVAVLSFLKPIVNGPGADFAVFENGFLNAGNDSEAFLELAFVEVSSDGSTFFRFPAVSKTDNSVQLGNSNYLNARRLNNFAGKYIGMYGVPFDLEELAGKPGLDVNNITHVRVVDVVGAVAGHSSLDHADNIVNDPYPTPFPSCGFDLDAVGVINQRETGAGTLNIAALRVYPNPVTDNVNVETGSINGVLNAVLSTATGVVVKSTVITQQQYSISLREYPAGLYFLTLQDATGNKWAGKIIKR